MTHRALAARPQQPGPDLQLRDFLPRTAGQPKAITLGVALRYLAVRRTKLVDPRPDQRPSVQRPALRVVT